MNRFQVVEITEAFNHAGTKAAADIAAVADRLGFRRVPIRMNTTEDSTWGKIRRQRGYYADWKQAEKEIQPGSVLLLQHPFHHKQLTREKTLRAIKDKNIKIISVVHDVEELRAFRYSDYYAREFQTMLDLADILIVHNETMKQWFINQHIEADKLISLEIFDYLQENQPLQKPLFEKSITIAGNLDTAKCGYLRQLGQLKNIRIHLYGPNFDEHLREAPNIEYHGSFPADEIPGQLNRGFGLVWDGESIAGCEGQAGQYLRYNNPHKLSLYLSSGLPVILWKGAAEAPFVESRGMGICVDSLEELENRFKSLSESDYRKMAENAEKTGALLRKGFYAEKALQEAAARIEGQEARA